MRNHQQQHDTDSRNRSQHSNGSSKGAGRVRGRQANGNWGTSDSDGQFDEEGEQQSYGRDGRDRDSGRDNGGYRRNMNDRMSGANDNNERGGYREETYGPRGRSGDDRSGQGGYGGHRLAENQPRDFGDEGYDGPGPYGGDERDGYQNWSPRSSQFDRDAMADRSTGRNWQLNSTRRSGPHVGKGPKGYRRSDERIKEEVSDELSQHGGIDASDIEVMVEGGEVTLSGTVPDRETKRRAEECVEECAGVEQVQNNLRVAASRVETGSGTVAENGRSRGKSGNNGSATPGSPANDSTANSSSGHSSRHTTTGH